MRFYVANLPDGSRLTAYIFTEGSLDPRYPVSLSIDQRCPDEGKNHRYHDSTHKTLESALKRMEKLATNWEDRTTV